MNRFINSIKSLFTKKIKIYDRAKAKQKYKRYTKNNLVRKVMQLEESILKNRYEKVEVKE